MLFFSLPPCAGAIIDFFREFTVHVEGVGYVCSFAVFDFKRHGTVKSGEQPLSNGDEAIVGARRDKNKEWRSNENKMEKSFLHFKATHPDWQPSDPASSLFLDKLVGMHQQHLASPRQLPLTSGRRIGGVYNSRDASEERRRERISRSRDRVRTKSPPALQSRRKLETMNEHEESEEEEEEGDWNKKVSLDEQEGSGQRQGAGREEEGFLKDVGMMGLLQQVMGRP